MLIGYTKLPHHTLKSWRTQFSKITQNDLDNWRKRAAIAYRKAQRLSQPGPAASPSSAPEGLIELQFSSSPIPNEVSQATGSNGKQNSMVPDDLSPEEIKLVVEDELNIISEFFANIDDNEEEDAVWARLTRTVCIKSF